MSKTIQVRDVPDDVRHRLTVGAAELRVALGTRTRGAVDLARRSAMAEMLERLADRPIIDVPETAPSDPP